MPEEGRTALYRLYDADDRLLHVDIAARPGRHRPSPFGHPQSPPLLG
jgi:hypothetical protein